MDSSMATFAAEWAFQAICQHVERLIGTQTTEAENLLRQGANSHAQAARFTDNRPTTPASEQ
jgi:hypothetical protein